MANVALTSSKDANGRTFRIGDSLSASGGSAKQVKSITRDDTDTAGVKDHTVTFTDNSTANAKSCVLTYELKGKEQ